MWKRHQRQRKQPLLTQAAVTTIAFAGAWAATPDIIAGDDCGNPMVHNALLALLPDGAPAATAAASGNWSDPATWGGVIPQPGEDVRIPAGITVTYDINDDGDGIGPDSTRFHFVRVDGTLTWAIDTDTTMYVDTLISSPDGAVHIGDDANPIPAQYSAEIIIIADDPMPDFAQLSRGIVLHGPNRIVGAPKTPFAAITGDALTGAQQLTLTQPPSGWNIGDTLVLGGTWYDPEGSDADNSRFHDEVLTITAIDGATVSFNNTVDGVTGLQWDHVRPSGMHFNADDLTIYVANLTRNITCSSELDPNAPDAPNANDIRDLRRGHVMIMHTPDSIARNAAFVDFGRLNKNEFIDDPGVNVDGTDGQALNVRGRYSFHHHRNLPQGVPIDLQNCVPAEVTGCVVWGSPGWGFVHHDSYSIFEENVAFDVLGSAFTQEAGNEIGRWERNISIKCTGDDDPNMTVEPFGQGAKRVANFDFGFNGEAYWIQGACQVEFIDNIAVSAAGGGANIFSHVDGNVNRDRGNVPVEHLRPEIQYIVTDSNGTIEGNRVPTNTFTGFEVSNSDFGLITWHHMRNQGSWEGFTCPCDANVHREYSVIDDFRFWNIYGQGIHMQYTAQVELRDGLITSSDFVTPGVDDKPEINLAINGDSRGFGLGMNGPTKRLLVENVIVEGWEFGVRTPLEGQINQLDDGEGTGSKGAKGLPDRRSIYRNLHLANNGDHLYRRQNGFSDPSPFSNYLVLEDCDFQFDVPNEPPTADFYATSEGPLGVVRLSGLAAFDNDTPNGPTPFDPKEGWLTNYSVAVNDPNYITSYAWDLDNDGVFDAFGEEIIAQFPLNQASPVTLKVWDHQGATHQTQIDVTPVPTAYEELIVDGDFDIEDYNSGSITSGNSDLGWFSAWASLENGRAHLDGQFNFAWVGQAVYDAHVRRGSFELQYDYALLEGHEDPNGNEVSRLHVRLWGINTEFTAAYREYPIPVGAVPYEEVLLYDEWFEDPTDMATVLRTINVGDDGFTYYMISFHGSGVDVDVDNDHVLIDNVTFVGTTSPCPEDINGDHVVDVNDLTQLLAVWGTNDPAADINNDGTVNVPDLLALIARWGQCD